MRVNEVKTGRVFKATPDHFYSKRQLPVKALEALAVLGKVVARFDALITMFDKDAAQYDAAYLLNFTTSSALAALDNKEKAFLPPVFRHLLVAVRKNWRDGGAVGVVQDFSNNPKYMKMLDDAFMAAPVASSSETETVAPVVETAKPAKSETQHFVVSTALSDNVIMTLAKTCGFDDHPKLSRLWDIAERGPLSERNKEIAIKAIKRCGYNSVEIETHESGSFCIIPREEIIDPVILETNAKSGFDIIKDILRKENAAPKPEAKQITEIEVGGNVVSTKTIPKSLVISKVPTAIGKGRTFKVTEILTRKCGDILVLNKGAMRVPAEYFEVAA